MTHDSRAYASMLAAGQVVNHYQPIVNLQTGMVVGAEILARLSDGKSPVISPEAFLPSALTRIDPLLLIETDPAGAHEFVVRWLGRPIANAVGGKFSLARPEASCLCPGLQPGRHGDDGGQMSLRGACCGGWTGRTRWLAGRAERTTLTRLSSPVGGDMAAGTPPALCSTPRGERASKCRDALRPDAICRPRCARRVKGAARFLARRERSHAQKIGVCRFSSMASTSPLTRLARRGTRRCIGRTASCVGCLLYAVCLRDAKGRTGQLTVRLPTEATPLLH